MAKQVILPFEDKPVSLMYQTCAFCMGIIQGNAKADITPWLSSKFINCRFSPAAKNKFIYYVLDRWCTEDKILFHQRMELLPESYDLLFKGDIISLFKQMLDLGWYVHGGYNEQCIPGKSSYQKRYYEHDYLLIGYDDTEGHFISVGYLDNGKFQRFTIPYECMKSALDSLKAPKINCNFWKYNEDATFVMNNSRFLTELEDYLSSTTSYSIYRDDKIWGIDAIKAVANELVVTCKSENYIDNRYTLGVYEHKKFMVNRIEYLLENGYLKDRNFLNTASDILKLSETAHLLGIKYDFTGNESISTSINELYDKMIALEKKYLNDVLLELKK